MRRVELLAPAGDLNRCKTAIRYGADAVYIGGKQFSLRARASNFGLEEIKEACDFAREHGAHIHVTVNMIPHEEDFDGLATYAKQLEEAGVTAVIVGSPSVMEVIHQNAPSLAIHCSTQMSITNLESVFFYQQHLPISRVVLARECSLQDVRTITTQGNVETEVFIHGGMCVNYSGRCTLSNRMTLRDANRGGCAQSCRWSYDLIGEKDTIKEFTMGSKDLIAYASLEDLVNIGVASFKIEGRMKTEYYIASVVSTYRRMLDEIIEKKTLSKESLLGYQKELQKAQNRQSWDGFLQPYEEKESIIHHQTTDQDVNHDFLGKVVSYQDGIATVLTRNVFSIQDHIEVLSPQKEVRSFVPQWIMNKEEEYITDSRKPMEEVRIPVPFEVEVDDFLRRGRP